MSWKAVALLFVGTVLTAGLVVGAVLYILFRAGGGPVEAADGLLQSLSRGDVEGAWRQTAREFRERTTLEQFEMFVSEWRLTEASTRTWHARSVDGDLGFSRATVRLQDNQRVPLVFQSRKHDERWQVTSIAVEVDNYPWPIERGTIVSLGAEGVVTKD
jgi:hypothetical protein